GKEGSDPARVFDPETCREILQVFLDHGHTEINTARMYCAGTSEEYLGVIHADQMGCKVQTKIYPTVRVLLLSWQPHSAHFVDNNASGGLRKHLTGRWRHCRCRSLTCLYLHGPDSTTPHEVTLKAANDCYIERLFDRFGISNYYSWELSEIVTLCRANGWVQPTVYQGLYNVINRSIETELLPCLKKFGMSFYAYNPLGGGFLTGRYSKEEFAEVEKRSRFDDKRKNYRARYFNDSTFAALEVVRTVSESQSFSMAEVSLRWMNHHSALSKERGDSIIIGASSVHHTIANLDDLDKGPLPETLPAEAELERAWSVGKPSASNYFHP
ncbi:Aldo/keto reductase, partial [Gonapodya prolifera JEL478]